MCELCLFVSKICPRDWWRAFSLCYHPGRSPRLQTISFEGGARAQRKFECLSCQGFVGIESSTAYFVLMQRISWILHNDNRLHWLTCMLDGYHFLYKQGGSGCGQRNLR